MRLSNFDSWLTIDRLAEEAEEKALAWERFCEENCEGDDELDSTTYEEWSAEYEAARP